jgi:hypothetical protein
MNHLDLQSHTPRRLRSVVAGFVSVKQTRTGWRVCWNVTGKPAADAVGALSGALPSWLEMAGTGHQMRALIAPLGLIDGAPEAVAREAVQALRAALPGVFVKAKKMPSP